MLRSCRIAAEILAVLLGVVLLLGVIVGWRLSQASLSSASLTPYIEAAVDRVLPATHTRIGQTFLKWNSQDYSVSLYAVAIKVTDAQNRIIAEIPNMNASLSVWGFAFGQFLPTEMIINHPQIQLVHRADGTFSFGGMGGGGGSGGNVKETLIRMADDLVRLRITHRMRVSEAVFDVRDEAGKELWAVSVPDIVLERLGARLMGQASIAVTQDTHVSNLNLHYGYDADKKEHNVTMHFTDVTPSLFAGGNPASLGIAEAARVALPLTGEMGATFSKKFDLASATVQVTGGKGFIKDTTLWDAPRGVQAAEITAHYDRRVGAMKASVRVDFGGPLLEASATGKSAASTPQRLAFEAKVKLTKWPMDSFDSLWPKPVVTNARAWMVASLGHGVFDEGTVSLSGVLPLEDPAQVAVTEATGAVTASGARVAYLDGMPALENVNGEAHFDLQKMTVQIHGGGLGDIKLVPFVITMEGLDKEDQTIDIPLKLTGSLRDVLRLIDAPRLGYAKEAGLSPDDFSGKLEGMVRLRFPLLNALAMRDVGLKAEADLSGLATDKLVKGYAVTQGHLALALDKAGLTLKGPTNVNGVPLQVTWKQRFHPAPFEAFRDGVIEGAVSGAQWSALGIHGMEASQGLSNVTLHVTQHSSDEMGIEGRVDMTPALMDVRPLNWTKPAGALAVLTFTAAVPKAEGEPTHIRAIDWHGTGVDVRGAATLSADGELVGLDLDPLMIGRTNAKIHFAQSDEGVRVVAEGASLDVSGLRDGKEPTPPDTRPKDYRLKIGTLYTSTDGVLMNAEGTASRDREGWRAFHLQGMADGHVLALDLGPVNGQRVLAISCDDFGKALKSLGFTNTVQDGALSIHGVSSPDNPRVIVGDIKIGAFKVRQLPVLALLLNATSPLGITGLLTDSAEFDRLKGKFRWEGDRLDLQHVRLAGAAMDMTLDGRVDLASGQADLGGSLAPFSTVNRLLGYVPLLGDIVTGDGGGVLAVRYGIKGPLADPKVSVNPISLLTPGALRNLFFGGEDDAFVPEEKNAPPVETNFNKKP